MAKKPQTTPTDTDPSTTVETAPDEATSDVIEAPAPLVARVWNPESIPDGQRRFVVSSNRDGWEPFTCCALDEAEAISCAVRARRVDSSMHRFRVDPA